MTLQEASSCFHLDIEMLRLYEESGFIRTEKTESGEPDYPEAELRKAAQLCALQRAGMELEELKKLCDLQRSGCCENAAAGCWNRSTKSSRRWTGWITSFIG